MLLLFISKKKKKVSEMLTGAPCFPGTESGGTLGLVPGGEGVAAGVETGRGAGGAAAAGCALGAGDVFKRFNASLQSK